MEVTDEQKLQPYSKLYEWSIARVVSVVISIIFVCVLVYYMLTPCRPELEDTIDPGTTTTNYADGINYSVPAAIAYELNTWYPQIFLFITIVIMIGALYYFRAAGGKSLTIFRLRLFWFVWLVLMIALFVSVLWVSGSFGDRIDSSIGGSPVIVSGAVLNTYFNVRFGFRIISTFHIILLISHVTSPWWISRI